MAGRVNDSVELHTYVSFTYSMVESIMILVLFCFVTQGSYQQLDACAWQWSCAGPYQGGSSCTSTDGRKTEVQCTLCPPMTEENNYTFILESTRKPMQNANWHLKKGRLRNFVNRRKTCHVAFMWQCTGWGTCPTLLISSRWTWTLSNTIWQDVPFFTRMSILSLSREVSVLIHVVWVYQSTWFML